MLALSCLTVIPMYKILPTKWRAFVLTSTSQCSWSLGHYDHVLPKREGWQRWLWRLPVSPDSDSQSSLSSHLWLYFWRIVDLQCWVSFRCTVKGFSSTYIYCCSSVTKSCLTAIPWMVACQAPWDSSGKNTGVGCHILLQGIFTNKGSNPPLLWKADSLPLSLKGSPMNQNA